MPFHAIIIQSVFDIQNLCFGREIGIPEKTTGETDHCVSEERLEFLKRPLGK
jgi:hypothetical protein